MSTGAYVVQFVVETAAVTISNYIYSYEHVPLTYRQDFVLEHSNSDITVMNVFVVIALVAVFGVEFGACCNCPRDFKYYICSAKFVANVEVLDDEVQSDKGSYQGIKTIDVYKGKDAIIRGYSKSSPGDLRTSCDGSTLTKKTSYLLSGDYYDGNDAGESIIYGSCDKHILWNNVTDEQKAMLEALRNKTLNC